MLVHHLKVTMKLYKQVILIVLEKRKRKSKREKIKLYLFLKKKIKPRRFQKFWLNRQRMKSLIKLFKQINSSI